MKTLLLTIIFCFSLSLGKAQITFEKSFGGTNSDEGTAVQQLADGSYIMAGNTTSFLSQGTDIYLVKTDVHGDTLWAKTYGGAGEDMAAAVSKTADNGFIIVGHSTSFGESTNDVYVIKTDANGTIAWAKTYGGSDDDAATSVQQDAGGNFIVTGYTKSFGQGGKDVYVLSIAVNGNLNWAKSFGGSADDYATSVSVTNDGGCFITGTSEGFSGTGSDVYFIKMDSDGNKMWSKVIGGAGNDFGKYGQETSDGGYIITGSTTSFGDGNAAVYLLKADNNGDTLFSKVFYCAGNNYGNSVKQTADGGYIITGSISNTQTGATDAFLIKTDDAGNKSWTSTFGSTGSEIGNDVIQTLSGEYIICGSSTFGAGNNDAYLIKTNSDGGTGCIHKNSMILDSLVASGTSAPADASFSTGATTVMNAVTTVNSGCVETVRCYDEVSNGLVVVTGSSFINKEPVAVGGSERSLATETEQNAIVFYPNPTSGQFNISGLKAGTKIEIFDVRGKLIIQSVSNSDLESFDITGEAKGLYFYRITGDGMVLKSGKIVKE